MESKIPNLAFRVQVHMMLGLAIKCVPFEKLQK